MGRFHDVTTSTIDRGNSMFSGLDTVISLQSAHYLKFAFKNAKKETNGVATNHFRLSFSSVKPDPARVAVVSLR